MKISNSYVTNSSSTSFVISSANALTKDIFLAAMGVCSESLLINFYDDLFEVLKSTTEQVPKNVNIKAYFKEKGIHIDEDVDLIEIEKRYNSGENILYGKLYDSGENGGKAEAFYTLESVVVIGVDLYFNARSSGY